MKYKSEIYICAAKRTGIGSMLGSLSEIPAPRLASAVIEEIVKSTALSHVDQVILGMVLTAGAGQAPARQAALYAKLPESVNALTINKVCSSGLKAVILAANEIELGVSHSILAGGMENMSLSPYILPRLRAGAKLGHVSAEDTIVRDGLWDIYGDVHMGSCAELCAQRYSFSRDAQDAYALESYSRAQLAIDKGWFAEEIVPVATRQGDFNIDEEVGKLKRDKISQLMPVFQKDGTITAANASSISDGAAVLLLCSEEEIKRRKLAPLARIISHNTHSGEPKLFGLAPIEAIRLAVADAGADISSIDLFEINEAFSSVVLACQRELQIPDDKLNLAGGAVALGHPIGASGARILVTLLHNLKRTGGKRGVAGICNGGGEATAVVVEML
jgi:acetyl-CoA C-acetyltransferase